MGIDAFDELLRKKLAVDGVPFEPTRGTLELVTSDGLAIELEDNAAGKSTKVKFSQIINPNVPSTAWKNPVLAVQTENMAGTLEVASDGATLTASALVALPATDGLGLAVNDSLALIGQTNGEENGLWTVLDDGEVGVSPWVLKRRSDCATSAQIASQMRVPVISGTLYAGAVLRLTTTGTLTLDVTELEFSTDMIVVQGELGWKDGETFGARATSTDGSTEDVVLVTPPANGGYLWSVILIAKATAAAPDDDMRMIGLKRGFKVTTAGGVEPLFDTVFTLGSAANGVGDVDGSSWIGELDTFDGDFRVRFTGEASRTIRVSAISQRLQYLV